VAPLVVSAASMVALAATMGSHAGLAFTSLLGAVLAWAPGGILSAYPSSYLSGPAAASGWAVVNAVGALFGGGAARPCCTSSALVTLSRPHHLSCCIQTLRTRRLHPSDHPT